MEGWMGVVSAETLMLDVCGGREKLKALCLTFDQWAWQLSVLAQDKSMNLKQRHSSALETGERTQTPVGHTGQASAPPWQEEAAEEVRTGLYILEVSLGRRSYAAGRRPPGRTCCMDDTSHLTLSVLFFSSRRALRKRCSLLSQPNNHFCNVECMLVFANTNVMFPNDLLVMSQMMG